MSSSRGSRSSGGTNGGGGGRSTSQPHLRSAAQQSQHAAAGLTIVGGVAGGEDDDVRESSRSSSPRSSKSSKSSSSRRSPAPPPPSPLPLPPSTSSSLFSPHPLTSGPSPSSSPTDPELVHSSLRSAHSHATVAAGKVRRGGGGGGGGLDLSSSPPDPSSVSLLMDDPASSLLSPSSSVQMREGRLNALIFPSTRYSSSKFPIRSFYDSQNEFIDSLKKTLVLHDDDSGGYGVEDEGKPSTAAYLAIQISLALTFVLLGLKLFTAIYSGSIAVVASAVDSALDVLSQGTLLVISRVMKRYDPYNYPAGKNRMEPVAVLLFSVIMGMAALFLLYESVTDLLDGLSEGGKKVKMDAVTVTILVVVIGIQLVMWVYCRRVAALKIPGASSADALAQDHINDVFINIIGGVPAIIAGYIPSAWIADPIGGILLSLYIAVRWTISAWEQVPAMTGKTADPSFLNQLTYLAGTHDPRILKVDTILAYHVGEKYQCEVHIVLAEDMSLREAHDIGESLEQKIERLDKVEMAFVHLDYEYSHQPEHVHKSTPLTHAARAKAAGKEVRRPTVDAPIAAAPSSSDELEQALPPPSPIVPSPYGVSTPSSSSTAAFHRFSSPLHSSVALGSPSSIAFTAIPPTSSRPTSSAVPPIHSTQDPISADRAVPSSRL